MHPLPGKLSSERQPWRNPWNSEREIADATRDALESNGWTVYPETHGFDLFAARGGLTLGAHTKLDAGTLAGFASLLDQVCPWPANHEGGNLWTPKSGPHGLLAVSARFADVRAFSRLGVRAICVTDRQWVGDGQRSTYGWQWGRVSSDRLRNQLAHDYLYCNFRPMTPLQIPEIVIETPAGVPSPRTSSAWKVAAVRMILRLRAGELVTSRDLAEAGLSLSTFRNRRWIEDSGKRVGRAYLWKDGPGTSRNPPPPEKWPEIVDALRQKDTDNERSTNP